MRSARGARVERILRAWSGPAWPQTADFTAAVAQYRSAVGIPGVAHSSMEYFRWAARSQLRAEGRRFAAAVGRSTTVPVLQLHGADDPWVLPGTAAASAGWVGTAHRCRLLPATGHFPHEERPAEVTRLLTDFLQAAG